MRNDMVDIPLIVEDCFENRVEDLNINAILHAQGMEKHDRIRDHLNIRLQLTL